MWICNRCQKENTEAEASCTNCGAPRSPRRFGSAPEIHNAQLPQQNPTVRKTFPASHSAPQQSYEYISVQQRPDVDIRPARTPMAGFARFIGTLLMIFLPILTGLIAWRQHDVLCSALLPLFQIPEELPMLFSDLIFKIGYIFLAVVAVLLSMLPGLWTILLTGKKRKVIRSK